MHPVPHQYRVTASATTDHDVALEKAEATCLVTRSLKAPAHIEASVEVAGD
jgi:hypothetical protein